MKIPGIIIAALRGGSGKTILSIGIIAALTRRKQKIVPFKKGPDYIDAGWLAAAAGRPCRNLDAYLLSTSQLLSSFCSAASQTDLAVIEGNRGLYDGIDLAGSTSTAELAKLLHLPVILCVDCTKSTRTMAAAVLGCIRFDPHVSVGGVILNRVAGSRHEGILRQSIEHHCGIPVIGAVPKLNRQHFPERHMGLIPTPEHTWLNDSIDAAANTARQHIDLDRLIDIADQAGPITPPLSAADHQPDVAASGDRTAHYPPDKRPTICVIKDSAFQFYYPENIDALKQAGAEVVFSGPLNDRTPPDADGIYIGGGFPETHARLLSQNRPFKEKLKQSADQGLPIYAECGGLIYLGKELVLDNTSYPMTGILPVVFGFSQKPRGHGYTRLRVTGRNPYFPVGTRLKGHEFHYSHVLKLDGAKHDLAFSMERGVGLHNRGDGLCYNHVLAAYTHIHALGTPLWATAMVEQAAAFKHRLQTGRTDTGSQKP